MKKIIPFLVSFHFATTVKAQISLGAHCDLLDAHIYNAHFEGVGRDGLKTAKALSAALISWKAGLLINFPLSKKISIESQFNLLEKGGKRLAVGSGGYSDNQFTYLEFPLLLIYRLKTSKARFFGGLGPVLSYGLSGQATYRYNTDTYTTKVKFDNMIHLNDHYKTRELGAHATIGYIFKNNLFFNAQYNLGITNNTLSPLSVRNSYGGIGIGYFLKRN